VRDAAAARQRINPGHRLLARYEGRYRLVSGRIVDVAAKRGYLVVDSPGEGPAKFVAAGDGDFFDPSGEEELAFDPAQSARTMSITWYERGKQAGAGVTGSRLSIR